MCDAVRLEVRCERIDPGDDGMLWRSTLVVPIIVTEIFAGFLMMGPPEASNYVQEVITEAVRLAPKLGTASRLYLATPGVDDWILERVEFDPDFRLHHVTWEDSQDDVRAAFQVALAAWRQYAGGPVA